MNKTQKLYNYYLENISKFLKENLEFKNLDKSINTISNLIKKSTRILCTANGSSIPAGMLLYSELLKNGFPITFVKPTLLNDTNFLDNDLVVIFSFGWSRGLIKDITEKVLYKSKAKLIVITSKIEKKNIYAYNKTLKDRIFTIKIFPNEEKLFCRPASSIISYIIALKLILNINGEKISTNKIFLNLELGEKENIFFEKISLFLSKNKNNKKIVFLTSQTLLSIAENTSLALKEGSGTQAEFFDIEDYGHGNYVTDLLNKDNVFYVGIYSEKNFNSIKQINRIKKLLSITNNKYFLKIDDSENYGGIKILYKISNLIKILNTNTAFDMNNPIGMKENKNFHKSQLISFEKQNILFLIEEIKKIHKNNKVTIIGISGGSASGKTSQVTPEICKLLNKYYKTKILNLDNFQKGKDFVKSIGSKYKYDDKRNFSLDEVKVKLELLKQGKNINIPIFSLEIIARNGEKKFDSGEIIIVEGIYATDELLDDFLDYKIYVKDDIVNMLVKRILRYSLDMKLKNGAVGALKQYMKYVFPAHIEIVSKQEQESNTIIKSNFSFKYLIKKYNLIGKKIILKKNKIIFKKEHSNLKILATNKKFYIVFNGLEYFSFEINNEIEKIIKNLNLK